MIFWIVLRGIPEDCDIISFVRPSSVFLFFISSSVIEFPFDLKSYSVDSRDFMMSYTTNYAMELQNVNKEYY